MSDIIQIKKPLRTYRRSGLIMLLVIRLSAYQILYYL